MLFVFYSILLYLFASDLRVQNYSIIIKNRCYCHHYFDPGLIMRNCFEYPDSHLQDSSRAKKYFTTFAG